MDTGLKVDRINNAYSLMRISGITITPSAASNVLALNRMESMASEFDKREIHMGYNKESSPDVNSQSGIDPAFWYAFDSVLAMRLLSDFGKGATDKVDPLLLKNANAGMSLLYSATATPKETQYPTRQPIGSGNSLRFNRTQYYQPVAEPNEIVNYFYVGSIYVGQVVPLTVSVGQDITGGSGVIKYRKPDTTEGSYPATIVTAATGDLSYTVTFDQSGLWQFWGYVTFADTTSFDGTPITMTILEVGT